MRPKRSLCFAAARQRTSPELMKRSSIGTPPDKRALSLEKSTTLCWLAQDRPCLPRRRSKIDIELVCSRADFHRQGKGNAKPGTAFAIVSELQVDLAFASHRKPNDFRNQNTNR